MSDTPMPEANAAPEGPVDPETSRCGPAPSPPVAAPPSDTLLHILRNPYGHSEQEIRTARLAACDAIERLERELAVRYSSVRHWEEAFRKADSENRELREILRWAGGWDVALGVVIEDKLRALRDKGKE